ncbi:MAG: hemolysin family protein [Myxococcota bacterium]
MDDPGIETIAAIVAGVLFGAIFAAVEEGLAVMGEVRLRAVRDGGGRYGSVAGRVLTHLPAIRARMLAGRVLSVAFAVAFAAWWALRIDGVLAAVAAAVVVSISYAVAAEVAITVMRQRASRGTLGLLRVLRPLELLLAPLGWPLRAVGSLTERLVPPVQERDSERITHLAVEHMIDEGEERGSIGEDHAELLRSVLEFKDTVAREVMVPRTNMVAFDITTPLSEVLERIVQSGHSRYPVYRERVDQMEGLLYAKDLFRVMQERNLDEVQLEQLVRRPLFFAPATQKIGMLLREMQARRVHLAVVVDEFGGTSGLLTLEDIVEEIVGEIQDEHDDEELRVEELAPGRYLVDAGISIYDLQDVLHAELPKEQGEYDSLGGMVVELAGRVPREGESVRVGEYELIVREGDDRHVTRIEIRHRPAEEGASEEAAEGFEAAE